MHGQWTCDKVFFKNIQIIGRFGQISQKYCGVFPVEYSAHILALCVRSSGFPINQPLSLKKAFLRYFKGMSTIWAAQN